MRKLEQRKLGSLLIQTFVVYFGVPFRLKQIARLELTSFTVSLCVSRQPAGVATSHAQPSRTLVV